MNHYPDVLQYAEETLVGQALEDPKVYVEAAIKPDQFFDWKLAMVWRAIGKVHNTSDTVDCFTVGNSIPAEQLSNIGGLAYLADLVQKAPYVKNTAAYSNKVREYYITRQVLFLGEQLSRLAERHTGADLLREAEVLVANVGHSVRKEVPTLWSRLQEELVSLDTDLAKIAAGEKLRFGLETGFGIDKIVPGGISRDKITAIFGESGNFKSTFKNNLIWGIAERGGKVLDISLEDSDELTTQRFIANRTDISYGKIAVRGIGAEDLSRIKQIASANKAISSRIYLGEDINPDIEEIIQVARYYKRTEQLDAVAIDYIQAISGDKDELDRMMLAMMKSAKRDKIAYIIVSQVKQDVDFRARDKADPRPRVSDMIGSSSFRFFPKLSIGTFMPSRYWNVPSNKSQYYKMYHELGDDGKELYSNVLELHIKKNVLGEPNVAVPVVLSKPTGKMVPMSEEVKALL